MLCSFNAFKFAASLLRSSSAFTPLLCFQLLEHPLSICFEVLKQSAL